MARGKVLSYRQADGKIRAQGVSDEDWERLGLQTNEWEGINLITDDVARGAVEFIESTEVGGRLLAKYGPIVRLRAYEHDTPETWVNKQVPGIQLAFIETLAFSPIAAMQAEDSLMEGVESVDGIRARIDAARAAGTLNDLIREEEGPEVDDPDDERDGDEP